MTNAEIAARPSHVDLTAEFHHPRDSFDRGEIHAHLISKPEYPPGGTSNNAVTRAA